MNSPNPLHSKTPETAAMFPSKYQRKFAGLRRRFLSGLPAREAEIEDLTATLLEHGASPKALEELYLATHKLAGISGTYGLRKLGDLAAEVEQLLEPVRLRLPTPHELESILVATDILSEELGEVIATA